MWKDVLAWKKLLIKTFDSVKGKVTINIKSTFGIPFKSPKCMVATNQLKTINTEGVFETITKVVNSNTLEIDCRNFKNKSIVFTTRDLFKQISYTVNGNSYIGFAPTDELQNGIVFYTNHPTTVFICINYYSVGASKENYKIGFDVLVNGKVVLPYTTQLSQFGMQHGAGDWLMNFYTRIKPVPIVPDFANGGKVTLQFKYRDKFIFEKSTLWSSHIHYRVIEPKGDSYYNKFQTLMMEA